MLSMLLYPNKQPPTLIPSPLPKRGIYFVFANQQSADEGLCARQPTGRPFFFFSWSCLLAWATATCTHCTLSQSPESGPVAGEWSRGTDTGGLSVGSFFVHALDTRHSRVVHVFINPLLHYSGQSLVCKDPLCTSMTNCNTVRFYSVLVL